ncbi:MAG: exodeoxyribonuclease VII large subunit [Dichotomicrobium sp.]
MPTTADLEPRRPVSTPSHTPPASNVAEYSVSEISAAIKRTMEDSFGFVRVRGELGRISRPASGHVYLDLKDERAVLSGVIWRGTASKLKFRPEEGLEVIATGRITTYPGSSKYQIVIESLEPAGAGALMALLEERKRKLAKEGLFDEDRKRALPYLPRVIGIVTSPSGAVIRDMLHGFDERFPSHILVWPVRVQGETCAAEVAAAVRGFNALAPDGPIPRPDLLIVARGGGSIEDLWGFNEEAPVRAVAASEIPVISAVGHETDWTLIDLVADARAPTPTKAAEWAVPRRSDLLTRVMEMRDRQRLAIRRMLETQRRELRGLARGLPRLTDLLSLPRQRFDAAAERFARARHTYVAQRRGELQAWSGRLRPGLLSQQTAKARERLDVATGRLRRATVAGVKQERQRLNTQAQLLKALSHMGVLARGFALVRDADGAAVRTAEAARTLTRVDIEFADGAVGAHIEGNGRKPAKPGAQSGASSGKPAKQGKLL